MVRIKPILFNTDMVQAVTDGRKTVTRRLVMPHNRKKASEQGYVQGSGLWIDPGTDNGDREGHIKDYSVSPCWMSHSWYIEKYAVYKPGDILYVREKWCRNPDSGEYYYAAKRKKVAGAPYGLRWHPSIHMPRKMPVCRQKMNLLQYGIPQSPGGSRTCMAGQPVRGYG